MDITIWDGPTWGVWITEKSWAKLTPAQQKIVEAVAKEAGKRDLEAVRQAAIDSDKNLRAKGVVFHKFPDAEKAKWKAKLPDYFAEFIAAQTAKGKGDDAKKMVQIWKEVVAAK
jgi:TRAP-type C4-dicarboxylate transport system substrate-binding protein